ncbi:MAG: hypothetical protein HY980_00580 [Candidatus Magasanikbacteria bacterium]|nr:hypothetical protein [Candidatus Magasanikbacteria bacterium]
MLKIIDAVHDTLLDSEIAVEALRLDCLNLRAFARRIHKTIEEKTKKPVKVGTIVVALSRMAGAVKKTPALRPAVKFDALSIRSPLCDTTFENTKENLASARSFSKPLASRGGHFFTMTQGVNEITFIISDDLKTGLFKRFNVKPKVVSENLVGINISFSERYLSVPNVIYGIIAKVAIRRINIVEIVSTYTELTLIIHKEDLEAALKGLNA